MGQWHLVFLVLIFSLAVVFPVRAHIGSDGLKDIVFVENRGQIIDTEGHTRPDVLFTAEAAGMKLFCRRSGISYVLNHTEQMSVQPAVSPDKSDVLHSAAVQSRRRAATCTTTVYRLDVEFEGASIAEVEGSGKRDEYFNYYYAHCPEGLAHVYSYNKVVYRNLYPGIDLVLYAQNGGLKYDFLVHPGGDPAKICLRYKGAEQLLHRADGSLRIRTPIGSIEEKRPYTYQDGKEIASRYRVNGHTVQFEVGAYDTTRPLVIDPDVLWSTYYGGSSEDWGYDVATDNSMNVIVTGYTFSIDFPIVNALQSVLHDDYDDAFIFKMTPDGKRIWATYYGGSRDDIAVGVATDATDGIAVVGRTGSPDFPVENAWQSTHGGAFVLKLTAGGQRAWATYLGSVSDIANGVATDNSGGVVVLGETWNAVFPVVNAFQSVPGGGSDAFVARFSASGGVMWATYLGGSGEESYIAPWGCDAIAVDNSGNVIVGGTTTSDDFPVIDPLQSTRNGETDCFVVKFSGNGIPVWSTYYGGQSYDYTYSITTDRKDNILIGGATSSSDFPVEKASQSSLNGLQDAFAFKLTQQGRRLWSTYYGGGGKEEAYGIITDNRDNVFLTGWTESNDMPLLDPFQQLPGGGSDAFAAGFDEYGTRIWATYFGGNDVNWAEKGHGIATDRDNNIVIVGATGSANLPMVDAIQPVKNGSTDAFIVRFSCVMPRPETTPHDTIRLCEGDSAIINAAPGYRSYRWSNGATTASIVVRSAGTYTVRVNENEPCNAASLPVTVRVLPRPVPQITGPTVLCKGERTVLQANAPYSTYRWLLGNSVIAIAPQVEISVPGIYTLETTNEYGCTGVASLSVTSGTRPTTRIVPMSGRKATFCPGDSLVLVAEGVFRAYAWSNGATTASITVREAGVYSVVVTGQDGCRSSAATLAVETVAIPADGITGPLSVCAGNDVEYAVEYIPGVSYQWTATGGAVATISDERIRVLWSQSGSNTLVLTRTVQDCSMTTTLVVSVADSLQPVITGVLELCAGATGELQVAGSYVSYQWANGATTAAITVDTPGVYTVTVRNEQGCSGSTTVTVKAGAITQPLVRGTAQVCTNSTVVYTIDNADILTDFNWNATGGKILSGRSTPTVTVLWEAGLAGSLSVTARNRINSCEGRTTLAITIGNALQPAITSIPSVACPGKPVVLLAGEGFASYLWSTGETTPSITVDTEGEYSVVVVDNNGCTGSTTATIRYSVQTFGVAEFISLGTVEVGSSVREQHVWVNNSSYPVRVEEWSLTPDLSEFDVSFTPPLPADIHPGDSLLIAVQFKPEQTDLYQSDLLVEVLAPCPETLRFALDATGTGTVVAISFPDTTAFPWQRSYRIPLYARLLSGEAEQLYTVEFTAAMDATVFFPTGLTRGTITGSTVDATTGERIISGSITDVKFGEGGAVLTEIIGDVLLGERDATALAIRSVKLVNQPLVKVEQENGSLALDGICREGDIRFIRSKAGFGVSIQPHPVQEELVALVELVEAGECSLELYSADGRSEMVRQWRHSFSDNEAVIVRYDISTKSAGVYWLVLRTPTQTSTRQFLIVPSK